MNEVVPREILHKEGFYPEESGGLFMGISVFEDPTFASVPFAVDDAIDLAWVFTLHLRLIEPKRTILALAGEPQKEVSRRRLAALLCAGARHETAGLTRIFRLVEDLCRSCGARGLLLFQAATHGLSDQGGDFLVAADSVRSSLLDTALKLPPLLGRISEATAKRRLVLLDSCRERHSAHRAISGSDSAMALSFSRAIGQAVGLTVLSGAVAGGYSYDDPTKRNGVFTAALVEGICGGAKSNSAGLITVGAVAEFAQDKVLQFVREHRRDHLNQSRGIERRFDENSHQLPLAVDPARTKVLEAYQKRRAAALHLLRHNIGGDLDGRRFEEIKSFLLDCEFSNEGTEILLMEIEALDGSDRLKRNLLFIFDRLRSVQRPAKMEGGQKTLAWEKQGVNPPVGRLTSTSPRHSNWSAPGKAGRRLVTFLVLTSSLLVVWLLVGNNLALRYPLARKKGNAVADSASVLPSRGLIPDAERVTAGGGPNPDLLVNDSENFAPFATIIDAKPSFSEGTTLRDSFEQLYRWVPAGSYTLGSPTTDVDRYDGEQEPYEIDLNGFWIGETEVTQAFWSQHVNKNPSRFKDCGQCPVEKVSWWEATNFANILSDQANLSRCYELLECKGEMGTEDFICAEVLLNPGCPGYRLPTENEWEAAARGQVGIRQYESRYGTVEAVAWFVGNSEGTTHPVGLKIVNPFGLEDVLGNVWEWTESAENGGRISRGGAWDNDPQFLRSSSRRIQGPNIRYDSLGIRLILSRPLLELKEAEVRMAP